MKTLSIVIVAAAVVLSTGCWQKKKKPVVVPPAPAPVTQPAPPVAPKATVPAVETPAPPPKPVVQRPKVQPAPRPAAPIAPAPQLGAMIPAAQRQQLDATYLFDLKKARAVLAAVGASGLDAQRNEMAARVKSFIKQAEEFHPQDLAAAAEMAQRARVLAEDLEKRSK